MISNGGRDITYEYLDNRDKKKHSKTNSFESKIIINRERSLANNLNYAYFEEVYFPAKIIHTKTPCTRYEISLYA